MIKGAKPLEWGLLGLLSTYLAAMYGGVMRATFSLPVVLMPWLLKQPGYDLYETVYIPYMPGYMWFNMAVHSLIPQPVLRVRLMMIVLVIVSLVLVFFLARLWHGPLAGIGAAVAYAAWMPLWADRPMYMEVMVGFLTLAAVAVWHQQDSDDWWQPLAAGILVGAAELVKQQALAVAGSFLIWRTIGLFVERDRKRGLTDMALFLGCVALLPTVSISILAVQGRVEALLYWTWTYPLNNPFESRSVFASGVDELILIVAWLLPVGLYILLTVGQRASWRGPAILILGQVVPLLTPMFPRYGRFHLSGAVPIIALIAGGALALILQMEKKTWQRLSLQAAGAGAVAATLGVFLLPTYYRVRLGPRVGEWSPLVEVSQQREAQTVITAGTRVWVLPA
ncbi:MAG: glycosyltransferase family 39 protein, partial [Anaerolineae bacterium]